MDSGILCEEPLRRLKSLVKLDRGFDSGTYCIYFEYDGLADDQGFTAARKAARDYASLLRKHFGAGKEFTVGKIEDHSESADPRRKRDLECTFLSFPVEYADGRWHDAAMKKHFQVALLRAGQAWEQAEAGVQARRHHTRQEQFRQRLDALLDGESYAHLDAAIKMRLAEEVTKLAFPTRGIDFS
jgi:hypothetical protein